MCIPRPRPAYPPTRLHGLDRDLRGGRRLARPDEGAAGHPNLVRPLVRGQHHAPSAAGVRGDLDGFAAALNLDGGAAGGDAAGRQPHSAVAVDGSERRVEYADVKKAKVQIEFKKEPS